MRIGGRIVVLVMGGVLASAGLTNTAAAALPREATIWQYEDRPDSPHGPIDVESTELDITRTTYRVFVYGREFIKNRTDFVSIYFDTARANHGPEYRYTGVIGKMPNGKSSGQSLERVDSWEIDGKNLRCGGMQVKLNAALDIIKITMPARCLGKPSEVRWAGYVGEVTKVTHNVLTGYWDDFPAERTLPHFWAS